MLRVQTRSATLAAIAAAFILAGASAPAAAQRAVDILIQGGTIYNGDSDQPIIGDVGISGDRIAFVGESPKGVTAVRTIDARGMVVSPGFIDAHTHSDDDVFSTSAVKRLNARSQRKA